MTTTSKHTPWRASCDLADKRRGEKMALVATGRGDMAIDCTGSGMDYADDCRIAALIAAAPDLLAALVETADMLATVLARARAAIAKARGERT